MGLPRAGVGDAPVMSRVISTTTYRIANHKRISDLDDGSLFDRGKKIFMHVNIMYTLRGCAFYVV